MLYGFLKSPKDVHTEHCCLKHGCKYGDDDCPVELGIKKQSYPCEWCNEDQSSILEEILDEARQWGIIIDKKKASIEAITSEDLKTKVR